MVDVEYVPVYDAVRENTELKYRITELEDHIYKLTKQLDADAKNTVNEEDIKIVPPNEHVDGYENYQENIKSFSDKENSAE